jgi:hypothetical protein
MVYNEPVFLPIWLRHYGKHLGQQNLFLVDHGSDDQSTLEVGSANKIRIPRTDLDEDQRANFVSRFQASLLCYYDAVIFTDVDEMLVPNPTKFSGLFDFVQQKAAPVMTALGWHSVD